MAAKQESKKQGRIMKKKPQKKCQESRQKQKLKAQKAKKTPRAKAASNKQSKICSPRLFASKILRQMPKVRMEAKARGLVKTMLTNLYDHVANEVETLSQKSDLSSIGCTEVQAFLKDAMEKELAKHTADTTNSTTPAISTTPTASITPNTNTTPNESTPTSTPIPTPTPTATA